MAHGSVTTSLSFNGRFIKSLNRRLSLQHAQDTDQAHAHDHGHEHGLGHGHDHPVRPTRLIKPRPRPSVKCKSVHSESLLSSIASDDIPSRPLSLPPGTCSPPLPGVDMSADRIRNVVKRTSMLFDRSNNDTQEIDINAAIAVLHELKKNATPEELAVLQQALLVAEPDNKTGHPPFHRRDSFKTPGLASRSPVLTNRRSREVAESPRKDRPQSHSISVPVKFAKGADKVAHKYSGSLGVNPHLSRSFTPADLEKESIGTHKLGTLRVTNGAVSPEPSMHDLVGEEPNYSANDLADAYATECGSYSDADMVEETPLAAPPSSVCQSRLEGPLQALRILDGCTDQPLYSPGSDSVRSHQIWCHDTHSKCDSGYGSESYTTSPVMDERPVESAATYTPWQTTQSSARRNHYRAEHRYSVSSDEGVRSRLPPQTPNLAAPSPEKAHHKRLYKPRPAPRKTSKSVENFKAETRHEPVPDIPQIPDELSTNFSRRMNRGPAAWPPLHVFTDARDASNSRGRSDARGMPAFMQSDLDDAGRTSPVELAAEVTKRKSFFRLRGRSRSKSTGRPEVSLPRDTRTVAETIDQSPTASPHLRSSEWTRRPALDQRSSTLQESPQPRRLAMSDEEARQLARKRSKDYLPGRSRSRPRTADAVDIGPTVTRQRSKSLSPRTERRLEHFEQDVPPVPRLPSATRQALTDDTHMSPLGSNPRQRSRTIAIDASVSPAIILSRYVTPKTLDLSAPVGARAGSNSHRRRADSLESGKASRAYFAAAKDEYVTPRSLMPGRKKSTLPAFEIENTSPDVLVDRYSGGLSYGWERGRGFHGSAGTRSADNVHKSVALRGEYGVDLTDVPVFLTAA